MAFKFSFPRATALLLSLLAASLFIQCSSKPKDLKGDCRERFDKIQAHYDKGKYSYAKEGFGDFIITCSGTEYVEQAHFELANSHFSLKEWMEAEEEFGAFLRDYPTSRRYAELARWRMAVSMGRQVEIPQRDQSKTVEAIREFETFVAEFPDSPRADTAQTELVRLSQLLADRDMLIARLYRRMDEPLAAAIYYKYLLSEYGDKVPRRDINLNLAEAYIELKQFIEAENILAQFDGVAKDDPFLEKIAKVRHKLEKAKAKYEKEKQAEKREELSEPRPLIPSGQTMRIGVLGGAFDPPHAAHAALARAAREQLNLDRIVWIPTFAPPHKGGPVASFADRVAMTRALAEGDPAFEVSEIEASLPQPSFTLHTLRALKPGYSGDNSWHLILGADNAAGFARWHQSEAVLAEASLAVYPREGFPVEAAHALPPGAVMLNFPVMPDQSTEFREALAAAGPRRDAALARLPGPVAACIRAQGLYA